MKFKLLSAFCMALFCQSAAIARAESKSELTLRTAPLELKYPRLDFRPHVLELKYPVENLGGAVKALQMKETKTEFKIELSGDILFDFDKATLRQAAEPTLNQVRELILKSRKPRALIEGFTDSKGDDSYNLKLSVKRAAAVKDWLVLHGVNAAALSTKGWGEAKPVAQNNNSDGSDNPDGRQKNRRVEITVKK